jgi:hypothetical protein
MAILGPHNFHGFDTSVYCAGIAGFFAMLGTAFITVGASGLKFSVYDTINTGYL